MPEELDPAIVAQRLEALRTSYVSETVEEAIVRLESELRDLTHPDERRMVQQHLEMLRMIDAMTG
jgi:hypothetical protein